MVRLISWEEKPGIIAVGGYYLGTVKGVWAKIAGKVKWPFLWAWGRETKAFGSMHGVSVLGAGAGGLLKVWCLQLFAGCYIEGKGGD